MSRLIPSAWLPARKPGAVQRIIIHWTAGNYKPSLFDRAHYHFTVPGDGIPLRGPVAPGAYLPHTRALNSGSVGLSICAMAGAVEGKRPYKVPVSHLQWERAAQAAAEICHAYGLRVTSRTVLCHSEVTQTYGIVQRGKWDVNAVGRLGEAEYSMSSAELHEQFRRKAAWYLERAG
jgi:hypothetical protein